MSKKIQSKKIINKTILGGSKVVNKPKFKLISYTMKAVIPTGQYANIQPEVTVRAATIEQAERAVMPYIESLFARYRDGGIKNIEPVRPVVAPVTPQAPKPTPVPVEAPKAPITPVAVASAPIPATISSAIIMTVPFTRAKGALESCTSLAALNLVSEQIEKSTKLIDSEKIELRKLASIKLENINGKNHSA